MDKITTLDNDEITAVKKFYYKSKDSEVIYEIPAEVAKLSAIFAIMVEQQKHICDSKENAVSLDVIYQYHTISDKQFAINTDKMLQYVDRYFHIWSKNPSAANYTKNVTIQTSNISHILKPDDLQLINDFINDNIKLINEGKRRDYPDFIQEKFNTDENYKRNIKLQLLNELLHQVDGFLEIESFTNKIITYIATLIWDISLVHIEEYDPVNIIENTTGDIQYNNDR